MKIGIDASSILPRRTGIGNYVLNLLKALLAIDSKNEYVILLNSFSQKTPIPEFLKKDNVRIIRRRIPGPLLINSWRLFNFPPIESLIGKVDIFHSPASYIPPQMFGLKVTTVHDLYFYRSPDNCDKLGGQFLLKTLPKRLQNIDKIIVPSFFTRKELIELLHVPEEKIAVVYEGVDLDFFAREISEEAAMGILKEYCLPFNYILAIGTLEPRKNIEGLIIAYKRLHEILLHPPRLVIGGQAGAQSEKLREMAIQYNLQKHIIFTGFIPQEHLPYLYRNALVFVYPSSYEGFGLPALEAMSSGTPVIASNAPALVETARDAAVIVDPENFPQMAERMKEIITSHKLREEYRIKGFQTAKLFSWTMTAKKTLKVYEDLAASR